MHYFIASIIENAMDAKLLTHRRPRVPASTLREVACHFSSQLLSHPFLVRCADGTIRLDELRCFLVQHGKYGTYFTRYLCALMSQLDSSGDVLILSRNLIEELGYGAETCCPHSAMYSGMLRTFGLDLENQPTYPDTQNLIDTMFMLCRQPAGIAGLGALCLGSEAIVPTVYGRLMEGFRRNAVPEQHLEFFAVHVQCDDGHADSMFSIIERITADSPQRRTTILAAGQTAVHARLQFFDALLGDDL